MRHTPCPHCRAQDSGGPCPMLRSEHHSHRALERARAVNCRVAYYADLYAKTGSYDAPEDER